MASFSMIHFNDVYNIEADLIEPLGGAARLAGYIKSCAEEDPVVFFSGDALSPSLISIFLKGEQMIPVMNGVGVTCAVLGNHDFDFGVDHLEDLMAQTKFPWLLSNVIDDFTNEPLAYAGISQIIVSKGIKIGLMGLVEEEWIDTLATIDPEDVIFKDYVESGREIAHSLRTQGADIVIALTHMRWPNDIRLAEEVEDLDIILGGHDHDYCVEMINGTYIVKSGTDFRNLSHIHVTKDENGKWKFDIKEVELDSSVKEDPEIKELVTAKLAQVDDKMDNKLGDILVDLDGRFAKIRTQETNLGNFVTDIILTATCADMTILNSGTFRSDRIHPRGDFIIRDLLTILPLLDHMLIIECTGKQIVQALENGVSQYPKLEGRFPQVAGCRFGFDPSKAKGHRIDPALVLIQDEYVDLEKKYRLCTKEYLAHGKDGYTVLKDCPILVNVENCPTLSTCIQNHFESVQMLYGEKECRSGHRQSLLCLVKKEEIIVKRQESSDSINRALVRQQSIHDAEIEKPHLAPEIDGRIFQYDDEKHMELLALKDSQSKKRLDVGRKEETTSRLDVGRKEETTSRLDVGRKVGRKEETTSRLDVGRKEETTSRLDVGRKEETTSRLDVHQKEATSGLDVHQKEATSSLDVQQKEATSRLDVQQKEATSRLDVQQKEATSGLDEHQKEATSRLDVQQKGATSGLDEHQKEATSRLDVQQKEATSRLDVQQKEATSRLDVQQKEATSGLDEHQKEEASLDAGDENNGS